MKVLIFGGAGFVGRSLIEELLALGYHADSGAFRVIGCKNLLWA